MVKSLRSGLVAVAMFGLAACGGGGEKVGSKEQARAVADAMSGAAQSTQSQGQALIAGATNVNATAEVDCAAGGKAKVSIAADVDDQLGSGESSNGNIQYDIEFDGCKVAWNDPDTEGADDGELEFNGDYSYTFAFNSLGSGSGSIQMKAAGKVDVSGAVSDSLELDLTYDISSNASTGAASVTIDGFVKTSSESYTFDNETYTSAGFSST